MDKDLKPNQPKNFKDLGATTLFRVTNFELFIKPDTKRWSHRIVMAFGLIAISFCSGYLVYMNKNYDEELRKQNTFINQELEKPKSRWD